jgi:hypothetical protein
MVVILITGFSTIPFLRPFFFFGGDEESRFADLAHDVLVHDCYADAEKTGGNHWSILNKLQPPWIKVASLHIVAQWINSKGCIVSWSDVYSLAGLTVWDGTSFTTCECE